jgi:hypothetical protein
MILLRLAPILAAAALLAAIVWASLTADIVMSFRAMTADPWGIVTLVDLYAGFVVMLVMIGLLEPRRWVVALVVVATPVFGSLVPAIWLAARFNVLVKARSPR